MATARAYFVLSRAPSCFFLFTRERAAARRRARLVEARKRQVARGRKDARGRERERASELLESARLPFDENKRAMSMRPSAESMRRHSPPPPWRSLFFLVFSLLVAAAQNSPLSLSAGRRRSCARKMEVANQTSPIRTRHCRSLSVDRRLEPELFRFSPARLLVESGELQLSKRATTLVGRRRRQSRAALIFYMRRIFGAYFR